MTISNEFFLMLNSYDKAKKLCENLGGEMALEIDGNFHHTIGDPSLCNSDPNYWIPVKLNHYSNGQYHWYSDTGLEEKNIDIIQWSTSQPNEQGFAECVGLTNISGQYYANDIDCDYPRCTVCKVPSAHTFYLRGPGPNGLPSLHKRGISNFLDRRYSLLLDLQKNSSYMVFEGQTGLSQISWYPSRKISTVKRYDNLELVNGETTLSMNYYMDPFGTFSSLKWTFTGVSLTLMQIVATKI